IWEAATGKHLRNFKPPSLQASEEPISKWSTMALWGMMALSPDGTLLALGSTAGPIAILDVAKGTELYRSDAPRRPTTQVRVSRDGKQAFTLDETSSIRIWDAATGKQVRQFPPRAGRTLLTDDGPLFALIGTAVRVQ